MTNNVSTKRLQSELVDLMMNRVSGVSAFPEKNNLHNWIATIECQDESVYANQRYRLRIEFNTSYPYKPPVVRFETSIFHPNVDRFGNICLDVLKEKWSAAYNVRTILISIQQMMDDANVDSPLNPKAAEMWNNRKQFQVLAKQKYEQAVQPVRSK